tara:strand:- start:1266 stop:1670 length:405 start_codon:yes stop_codon:yes gene_type:complete
MANTKKIEGGGEEFILDMIHPSNYIGGTWHDPYGSGIKRTPEQVKEWNKKLSQNHVDMLRIQGQHFKTWQDRNSANDGTKLNGPMMVVPQNPGPEFYEEARKTFEWYGKVQKDRAVLKKMDEYDKQIFKARPGR